MKKIIVLFSIIFALFVGVDVYAEDASFQCGTSPETVREATNALIQKKMMELNNNSLLPDGEVSLASIFPPEIFFWGRGSMPSTGTVRALVIPLTFPGYPVQDDVMELLQDQYFGEHKDADPSLFLHSATSVPRLNSLEKLPTAN